GDGTWQQPFALIEGADEGAKRSPVRIPASGRERGPTHVVVTRVASATCELGDRRIVGALRLPPEPLRANRRRLLLRLGQTLNGEDRSYRPIWARRVEAIGVVLADQVRPKSCERWTAGVLAMPRVGKQPILETERRREILDDVLLI